MENDLGEEYPLKDMSESARMSFLYLHPELLKYNGENKEEATQTLKDYYELKYKDGGIKVEQLLEECYNLLLEIYKDYVDMPEDKIKILSVWVIGAWFHELFNTYPYVFFNAMRGSGKTRILRLTATLGPNGSGKVINSITEAVLFRIKRGTITCIDEFEQVGNKEKQTLRELLNSAYKKGMKVTRMKKKKSSDGEAFEAEDFEPYFPIAMANIWGMDEVLGDRSIPIILEKSSRPEIIKKVEDFSNDPRIKEFIDKMRVVMKLGVGVVAEKTYQNWNKWINMRYSTINNITTLTTLTTLNYTKLHSFEEEDFFLKVDNLGISGRNFELLFPLLLMAKRINENVFEDICKIGSEMMLQKKEDEYTASRDVSFYEFISKLDSFGLEFIAVRELTQRFKEFIGETDSFNDEKWLNEKWIGNALKRLNLVIDKKRTHKGIFVVLNFVKAKEKLKIFKSDSVEREDH